MENFLLLLIYGLFGFFQDVPEKLQFLLCFCFQGDLDLSALCVFT